MALNFYVRKAIPPEKSITGYLNAARTGNTLTNVHVPLEISASSGSPGKDLTDIFTEIGDAWGKLRIYDKDDNRLYVEVKQWSSDSKLAWLWIKIPSYNSAVDTKFTIKYSSHNSIDSTYIGVTGSSPAAQIWTGYGGVWHMAKTGTTEFKDSSGNGNNGTLAGTAPTVTSYGGSCVDFNGSSNINCGSDPSLDLLGNYTVEIAYELEASPMVPKVAVSRWGSSNTDGFNLGVDIVTGSLKPVFRHEANSVENTLNGIPSGSAISQLLCQQAIFTTGVGSQTYTTINGFTVPIASISTTTVAIQSFNFPLRIGSITTGTYFRGRVYEVRLKTGTTNTSVDHTKVLFFGLGDNLVYYDL